MKANADKLIIQMFQPDHRHLGEKAVPWTDMYLYLIDPSDTTDGDVSTQAVCRCL